MVSPNATRAGTPVIDLDDAAARAYLDAESRASLGVSADEFRESVRAGTVDWDNPDSLYVAGLLGVNGAHP